MKLFLSFVFISALSVCFGVAQSESGSATGQNSASSTQHQEITNGPVAEYVGESECTIGWSARVPGTMAVRYGTDRTKLTKTAQAVSNSDGRNHHARLNDLAPNTRYYFQVVSADAPVSGVGTFETVAKGEQPIRSKAVIPQ